MRRYGLWVLYALFFLSGSTGLVYEVVWTRQLVFLLGGTTYAITTVLVAFMSGLALGSWLSGRFSTGIERPERIYGLIEIVVGVYALLVPVLLRAAEPLYRLLYAHAAGSPGVLTAARFCVGAFALLLPATCMGATLPLLVKYISRNSAGAGRSSGLLYGINTCGAMLGTLLAGFLLIPQLGLRHTNRAAAAMNVMIGLVAMFLLRPATQAARPGSAGKSRRPQDRKPAGSSAPAVVQLTAKARRAALLVAGVSGFAAMVYQIAWTRALIMSLGSSTYAFTCILAAFILGLGTGSLAVARWVDRWSHPLRLLAWLEIGIGLTAVLIVPVHGRMPEFVHSLVASRYQDYPSLLRAEFALVIAVTFVPTVLMGAAFPLLVRIAASGGAEAGTAAGRTYAINTLGTIIGSFLAGFVLIRGDVLGIQYSIVAAAAINAAAGGWLLMLSVGDRWSVRRVMAGTVPVAIVILLGRLTDRWQKELITSAPYLSTRELELTRRSVLYLFEDVDATVSAEELTAGPNRGTLGLAINGKTDASTDASDLRTQLLVGHLPALVDQHGEQACIIGLGSGMTLAALTRHPSYQRIDCVELSEGVIRVAGIFKEYNYDILNSDSRVNLLRADGRNHLLLTDRQYDLIVSEPSNPWLVGVANLFTREFFDLCRRRLADEGVFCVWLQGYMTSGADFRMVVRTLFDVFDSVTLWEAGPSDYCLICRRTGDAIPLERIRARFEQAAVREDLHRIALDDLGGLLGNYLTGGDQLRAWVEGAPIHTDDNALLEFRAPRFLYSRETRMFQELVGLLHSPLDSLVMAGTDDPATAAIRSRVEMKHQSFRTRIDAARQWDQGRPAECVRMLLDGYRKDPGDYLLFHLLVDYGDEIEEAGLRGHPHFSDLWEQIANLRGPPVAAAGTADGPRAKTATFVWPRPGTSQPASHP